MTDPLVVVFLLVIVVCVPLIGYLLPQDPGVARRLNDLSRRRRHRQLRQWVHQQHVEQRRGTR